MNVSLVGAGYWSANVIRNILKFPNLTLKYICETDISKHTKLKEIYKNIEVVDDLDRILNDESVQAVFVVTPINTHFEIVNKLLESGKHVACQKPLAHSSKSCRELVYKSNRFNLILQGCHTYLFTPEVQYIKANITKFGNLIRSYSSSRINLGLFDRKNSVVFDLGPHEFSILLYLFPDKKIEYISAHGVSTVTKDLIDTAHIIVKFENFIANITLSWVSAIKKREIIIIGSDKTLIYNDCEQENKLKYYDYGISDDSTIFKYQKGDMFSPQLDKNEGIYVEIKNFIECIEDRDKINISDGEFSTKVVELIEVTSESIKNGGRAVYL